MRSATWEELVDYCEWPHPACEIAGIGPAEVIELGPEVVANGERTCRAKNAMHVHTQIYSEKKLLLFLFAILNTNLPNVLTYKVHVNK
jgi:hypothetical protein